jgi:hypothetical protein
MCIIARVVVIQLWKVNGIKLIEMKDPKIKTKVVHSESKIAWNVVGCTLGGKHKIARVPYLVIGNEEIDSLHKAEALHHAKFISYCFNHSAEILNLGMVVIKGEDILIAFKNNKGRL